MGTRLQPERLKAATQGADALFVTSRTPPDAGTGVVIAAVTSAATALLIFTWHGAWAAATSHPVDFVVFLVLTAALMLLAVDIYGKGSISVAGVMYLATGF